DLSLERERNVEGIKEKVANIFACSIEFNAICEMKDTARVLIPIIILKTVG
ncbi:2129_t:CDS:1, partial [Acaulospora morrowiae]